MVSPLKEAAGPIGLNDFMEYVLNHGAFPPDFDDSQVESCVKRLLPYLQKDPAVPEFHCHQTSTYGMGWKKMKAKTSASPYGLTFSQIKAMTLDPRLAHIPAVLGTTPFEYGFSPLAWRKALIVALEKEMGNFRSSKLRFIGLLDSLYNFGNKDLGRHMMSSAEKYNLVTKEQYGGRKGKECIDQCINKVLTCDHWRVQQTPGILTATDLKSCYDRLVYPVATLCSRRWGALKEAL
jgi:hypothetical protein